MQRIELNLFDGRILDFDRSIFHEAQTVPKRYKRHTNAKTIVKLNYESEYGDTTIVLVKETKEEIERLLAMADELELLEKTKSQTL